MKLYLPPGCKLESIDGTDCSIGYTSDLPRKWAGMLWWAYVTRNAGKCLCIRRVLQRMQTP